MGTFNCLAAPMKARSIDNSRAHHWSIFWASFEPGDFVHVKVKAHATVQDVMLGKISENDRHGNHLADYWAKKGAWLEAPGPDAVWVIEGCRGIAHEAIRYAARLEARLADEELWDSEGIVGAGDYVLTVEAEPAGGLWAAGPQAVQVEEPVSARAPWKLNGHTIMEVEVTNDDGTQTPNLLYCTACGAHAHKQVRQGVGLAGDCNGSKCKGLINARNRLSNGKHPHQAVRATIGEAFPPSAQSRRAWDGKLGQHAGGPGQEGGQGPARWHYGLQAAGMDIGDVLKAYGIESVQEALESGKTAYREFRILRVAAARAAAPAEPAGQGETALQGRTFEEGLEDIL